MEALSSCSTHICLDWQSVEFPLNTSNYLSSAPSFCLRLFMSLFMMASICLSLRVLVSSCRMKFTA